MALRKNSAKLNPSPSPSHHNHPLDHKTSSSFVNSPSEGLLLPPGTALFADLGHSMARSAITEAPSQQLQKKSEGAGAESKGERGECGRCRQWREWAQKCEKTMLLLEREMMGKMKSAARRVETMEQRLASAVSEKQRYEEELRQVQTALKSENSKCGKLTEKVRQIEKDLEQTKPESSAQHTPLKPKHMVGECQERTGKVMGYSQFLSENMPAGKASTIATKPTPGSLFNTVQKDLSGQWGKKGDSTLEKCLFENQILKDYNISLLQRLKESKYRR